MFKFILQKQHNAMEFGFILNKHDAISFQRRQRTISYTLQKSTLQLGNCDMKIFHTQCHKDKSTKDLSTSREEKS